MPIRLENIGKESSSDEFGNRIDINFLRARGILQANGENPEELVKKHNPNATHYFVSGNQIVVYVPRA